MDNLEKFEKLVFPKLLDNYRVVRNRDYYREPQKAVQSQAHAQAPDLLNGVQSSNKFWPALEGMLTKATSEAEANRIRMAFAQIYQEFLGGLNLEDIEEVAQAALEARARGK